MVTEHRQPSEFGYRRRNQIRLNFSRIPQLSGLFLSLISKALLRADPTRKPCLARAAPDPQGHCHRSSPAQLLTLRSSLFPSGLRDRPQLGCPLLWRTVLKLQRAGSHVSHLQGLAEGVTPGWGRAVLGEGLPAPPTEDPSHKEMLPCRTEVWYYQPRATGKWIKMPLTQQIKLTVK